MQKLRHNKKRNLGLVYEFLTREVSSAIVAGDRKKAATAMNIIAKHLAEGTVLYGELSLHRQVMETRAVSSGLARRIVDELKAAGVRFGANSLKINSAKSALIHEMNKTFGQDVFDRYRIADYTAHASVNILMSRGIGSHVHEAIDSAKIEEHLTDFLTSKPSSDTKFDRDASLYTYKTAVGLFEKEFGKELSPQQSELLREYVKVSLGGNPAPFNRMFEKQRGELREVLRHCSTDEVFKKDVEMSKRLDEAISDLDMLNSSLEESIERLMMYHNLRKEIES